MTGSLRLSALLLLLLSRWASADLEKGEDEFVRSWVIIEEQLVPPSRDELLATGGVGTTGGGVSGGGVAGRRITPKSVFVAPSFNKCSDGYRPDSMGRCVKVVKINQAAQWDFLIKQLNSMYGAGANGGGFPMLPGASAYQPATTTTTEPPSQKTDSPGPFQLNIPLGGVSVSDVDNQTMDPVDELTTGTTTTAAVPTTTNPTTITTTTTTTSTTVTSTTVEDENDVATTDRLVTTTVDGDPDDRTAATVTATAVTTDTADTARPRPYRNRYQTTHAEDAITVTPLSYDSTKISTTYAKTKYADSSTTTIAGTEDPPQQTFKTTASASLSSSYSSPVVTTTAVDATETDNPVTAATPPETEEEDVVTVLAVAAADSGSSRPVSTTRLPYTTGGRTQSSVTDTVTPEYYDDQPEEPTSSPEPDCSAPNAYRYYAACAGFRQQQQFEQLQQQQQLLQQHQQQQQLYQQQQQQFYQQQQHNHMATELVKRPAVGGGVQVRFPGDEDPVSATVADSANLIRFPGPAPYRTTNKMYESSRHPTWWPTGWPNQQQQQQQYPDDSVQQQHRLQHHLPQQKQDVRLWEFGSRLPKTTSTTTIVPAPPTQWYHRFF